MFWNKIDRYVEEHHMARPDDKVLLALSGGADSVCLAHYFLWRKMEIAAVHVNHMLRDEEALRDEDFVRDFCRDHDIALEVVRMDVGKEAKRRGLGLEEAGRALRYECFYRTAKKLNCRVIALAHQADDQAETILFHLARGTGLRGLQGIPPVNGMIIRPLLAVSREEIIRQLAGMGQDYVTDSSNHEDCFSRNYIRNRILPLFQQLNSEAASHIQALAGRVRENMDYLDHEAGKAYAGAVRKEEGKLWLSYSDYEGLHACLQNEILLRMVSEIAGKRKDISSVHLKDLRDLMEKRQGKKISLPRGIEAVRTGEGLVLRKKEAGEKEAEAGGPWEIHPDLEDGICRLSLEEPWGHLTLSLTTEKETGRDLSGIMKKDDEKVDRGDCVRYFDYDKVKSQILIRNRRQGDYFIMDREGRSKKLRRYFIDNKTSPDQRDQIPLLADGPHILWILGGRVSEAYRVSNDTRRILRVRWEH